MSWAVYIVACVGFCLALILTKTLKRISAELAHMRRAYAVLAARDMDDDEKEAAVRTSALKALQGLGHIVARMSVVALATVAPVWIADATGLQSASTVIDLALDPVVGIATVVVALSLAYVARRSTMRQP